MSRQATHQAIEASLHMFVEAEAERRSLKEESQQSMSRASLALQEAASKGFNCRSALGQVFSRAEGKSETYLRLTTVQEKADFRKKWAAARLAETEHRKVNAEGFSKQDYKDGKYLTFERIAVEYGGSAAACVTAAERYCAKAARLGQPWLLWDAMGEVYKFLYYEVGCREVFEQAWHLFEEPHSCVLHQTNL
eukprot:15447159-Alexandrium_andersonii.AAC.1